MELLRRLVGRGAAAVIVALAVALPAAAPFAQALAASGSEAQGFVAVTFAELPPEAQQTLRSIREGGPYPHERDGVVFGNIERLLPSRGRGYYREYTVMTPGVRHRGARRIVEGRGGELYYSEDHYRSFRRVIE